MPEPLTDAYLAQCEWDARKFSGAYTGTSRAGEANGLLSRAAG